MRPWRPGSGTGRACAWRPTGSRYVEWRRRRRRGGSIRSLPPRVVVYTASGCQLCEHALEVVARVCGDTFERVEIDGDPALEASYRTSIPVVEVDGERAFTYFVHEDALRRRLNACG